MRQYHEIGQSLRFQTAEGRTGFGHLHQGNDALLHPCSARSGKQDERKTILYSIFCRPGDFLPDNTPHGRHHETAIHHANQRFYGGNFSFCNHERLAQATLFLICLNFFLVPRKFQWIHGVDL